MSQPRAAPARSVAVVCAAWLGKGEGGQTGLDEAVVAVVNAVGQAETACGFEGDEAVQGGAEGARGVDGVRSV